MHPRPRAPGKGSPAVEAVNARLRGVHRELRRLEVSLAEASSARERRAVLRQMRRLFALRQNIMQAWVEAVLPLVTRQGAAALRASFGGQQQTSRLVAATVRRLQAEAFEEIAAQTTYLGKDTKRLLRTIVAEVTRLHVENGLGIPDARRAVAAQMDSIGLRAFVDKAGRAWRPDTYAEMVTRTRTALAYNLGTVAQAYAEGVERLEVFDGVTDDLCAQANGLIVSVAWAEANPIAHPNCVRAFAPAADERAKRGAA